MMLVVPILLSLFWAICSTVLIQPWFWISVIKRKTVFGDEKYRGWSKENLKSSIALQIAFFCITFAVSLIIYLWFNVRYNLYGAIIPILLILFFQWRGIYKGWNDKENIKSLIILGIGIICLFFSMMDLNTSQLPIEGIMEDVEIIKINKYNTERIFGESDIARKCNTSILNVSEECLNNGRTVFLVKESPIGTGIVIGQDYETAKFIRFRFKVEVEKSFELRQKYPFENIRYLKIVLSNEEIPYAKYLIFDKPNLFGPPVLKKYVLKNLTTGEITEYMPNELPEFAM